MSDYNSKFTLSTQATDGSQASVEVDAGLRKYMLSIYNYMASALTLTGIVAYFSANTPAIINLLYAQNSSGYIEPTGLAYLVMFSPLAFILVLSFGINKIQSSTAQAIFWAFAAVMGLSLSNIFLAYTGTSITRVFFITAGTFAGMSLYGYTTKRDLKKRLERTLQALNTKPLPRNAEQLFKNYAELFFDRNIPKGVVGRKRNMGDLRAFLNWAVLEKKYLGI